MTTHDTRHNFHAPACADFSSQLPGETAPAFAAFLKYRDLHHPRSIKAAYSLWKGRPLAASGGWERWSAKHHWVDRAAAYDAHTEAVKAEAHDASLRSLEIERAQLEIEAFHFQVRSLPKIEALLDKLAAQPLTDVTQTKTDPDGNVTRTVVKGIHISYTALLAECRAMCDAAALGPQRK